MLSNILYSTTVTSNKLTTNQLMWRVILALIPGIVVQYYFWGHEIFINIVVALASSIFLESMVMLLRGRPIINRLKDGSATITGLLLALSLPPELSWWIIATGIFFAIVIAKHVYGGLGHNLFNPAIVGYVVLLISFPVPMSHWPSPKPIKEFTKIFSQLIERKSPMIINHSDLDQVSDTVTQATPLACLKHKKYQPNNIISNTSRLTSRSHNSVDINWLAINISFLLGGLWLLLIKVIPWSIPISFLATLITCSSIGWLIYPNSCATPFFHLFSGGTMLGAWFISTDPVTAATSSLGRIIFGIIIGFLIYLIRITGNHNDGIAFAVLIANMLVPLLDRYMQPAVYGK